jgi:uncharacterized membrane protein
MCMSSRTQAITNPLGHLLINGALAGLVVACVLDDIHIYDMYCYLLIGALAGLVVACVLDDIHIYDMYCYLLTGALAGLVVACVLDDIHIYDTFFVGPCICLDKQI